jgi:hypothetical protein
VLHQIDIVTTFLVFLQGALEPGNKVYMKQLKGFEESGLENHIWELQKGLYGLPQGSHIWNKVMNKGMSDIGFVRVPCEYCLYLRDTDSGSVLTGIHVDDFFITTSDLLQMSTFKIDLSAI